MPVRYAPLPVIPTKLDAYKAISDAPGDLSRALRGPAARGDCVEMSG
jgi:hypothetical protein